MKEIKRIYKGLNIKFPCDILMILETVNSISKKLNQDIFLVGGYVRDLLLGIDSKDLDFITMSNSIEFLNELHRVISGRLILNERFLTGRIILKNGINIDIANIRDEEYERPGSLPKIKRGSLIDDLKRRDFSINTLLLDFRDIYNPRIIDYLGGFSDLKYKYIKILHEKSFIDDPTRIFRAIRMSYRLRFNIEKCTLSLISEAVYSNAIENVSKDRLFKELEKVIQEENSHNILKKLLELKLLSFIDDNVDVFKDTLIYIQSLEENSYSIVKQLNIEKIDLSLVKLMLLLHKVNIEKLTDFFNMISISKKTKDRIVRFSKNYYSIIENIVNNEISPYSIYKLLEHFDKEELLCCIVLSNYNKIILEKIKCFLFQYSKIKLLITGTDLNNLGINPGPIHGLLINKLREEIFNNNYITRKQQLEAIKKIINTIKKEGEI